MKSFRSPEEMLDAHELIFGDAGRQCAEVVLPWAKTLFAVPLDALNIRVVLAPVEIGPYNRHAGYHYEPSESAFILGNVTLKDVSLVLAHGDAENFLRGVEDFIVHERQHRRHRRPCPLAAACLATKRKRVYCGTISRPSLRCSRRGSTWQACAARVQLVCGSCGSNRLISRACVNVCDFATLEGCGEHSVE